LFTTLGTFNPKTMNGDSMRLANFRSNHPGGVNMMHCDGSLRFWSETTDHALLDAMATRGGGEIVSGP
jgi:prepilin-type processing-associated H-X9-DG protein